MISIFDSLQIWYILNKTSLEQDCINQFPAFFFSIELLGKAHYGALLSGQDPKFLWQSYRSTSYF